MAENRSINGRRSVLFINRVYPPAEGATGEMLADLASMLARGGWKVTVVTGAHPSEPRVFKTENGIEVQRVRGFRLRRTSHWQRAFSYLWLYPMLLLRVLRLPAHDVVVSKTDPPLQLILSVFLKRLKKSRAIHWAQDLYPEIAEQLGVIVEESLLSRSLRGLSTWALHAQDHVVVVGRCMQERLQHRGIQPEHITVIPNWPAESIRPLSHDANPFRVQHDLQGRFVVMYSGNMGLAHPFESILDAAEELQYSLSDAVILFVGDGPRRDWIEGQVRDRVLKNVCFLPFQPKEKLAESLSAADLHLVTMLEKVNGLVVPSKVYGALAAGRPCLFLGPRTSEAARFIEEHGCGEILSAPSMGTLADQILHWYQNEALREEAGSRARDAVKHLRLHSCRSFEEVLSEVVGYGPLSPFSVKSESLSVTSPLRQPGSTR